MKHKFLLPLALMFLLLPVTTQAEEDDFEEEVAFLEIVQGYYNIVESTYNLHANPESATILHLFTIQEIYEERGEAQRAIAFLEETLKRTGNPTIRSVIHSMLIELNEKTGDPQKRLEFLQTGLDEALSRLQ